MVLKLYAFPASPPCRAVHALLDVLRLPVEYIRVHPLNGETRTKEFTQVCGEREASAAHGNQ